MNRAFLLIALFFAIGIGVYYYLLPQRTSPSFSDKGTTSIDLLIEYGRMEPSIVRVPLGAAVIFLVNSDEPGSLRIDEYEITSAIAKGRTAEVKFVAKTAGTFDMHIRPVSDPDTERFVGTLVVEAPKRDW